MFLKPRRFCCLLFTPLMKKGSLPWGQPCDTGHWKDEINSILSVTLLTAQERTQPAGQGHTE